MACVDFILCFFFFFQAEDGIRDYKVTGVQTCALPISEEKSIEKHAEKILVWMHSKSPLTGFGDRRTFTRREIQQSGPRPRDPESVSVVLQYLLTHGHIQSVFGSDKGFQLSNTNNTLSNLESVNYSKEFTENRGLLSSDTTGTFKRSVI